MPDDVQEPDFLAPPPFSYDGVVRESSYTMRHILASWEAQLGVRTPLANPAPDSEAHARLEHAELQTAIGHAKNVLRSLASRRDALADSLLMVTRPRVEEANRDHARRVEGMPPSSAAKIELPQIGKDDDDGA